MPSVERVAKPTLIYDGECKFCGRWVERWRENTCDKVDYLTSREAASRFPAISQKEFTEAVQWVGAHGERLSGAPAILAALSTTSTTAQALRFVYRNTPPLAWGVDAGYRLAARNRAVLSGFTRLLWGPDVRPPRFAIATWLFLRLLGFVYGVAFLSYWIQFSGLNGEHGILPAVRFFERAQEVLGPEAYLQFPSMCWLGSSDAVLSSWCAAGVLASIVLMLGFVPMACLAFLWLDYLSLTIAGQLFYQFQWDILLLEAGFLGIFLAPRDRFLRLADPPRSARFLVVWLLFRLVFASGVVKLASGDQAWTGATALNYHYFTQPLPTPVAWFAQQLPAWWQTLSVLVMFFIELVLPFFLFGPRRLRLVGAGGIIALQIAIALTGNYGFFNLLTICLCLLAIDDLVWGKLARLSGPAAGNPVRFLPKKFLAALAVSIFLLSLVPFSASFRRPMPIPAPLAAAYGSIAPFRTISGYGLFAIMTQERREIVVQGSEDGISWKTYPFRFKPGGPGRAPRWVAPYMPRLDWQMWFAALGSAEQNSWFVGFLERLLEGSPQVLGLLENNPFPEGPPRFARALTDRYRFTTVTERKRTGDWWNVEPLGIYYPEASLRRR
jgi:lipase maturation factor 1